MNDKKSAPTFNLRHLKARRIVKGVHPEELAAALGIKTGAYYKRERGHSKISVDELGVITSVLGMDIDDIGYFYKDDSNEEGE